MNVKVKICGITRFEDASLAAELGAAAIGFIFWPGSPRFVDPFRAKRIASALPPFLATVGVFVNQPAEHVGAVARLLNLAGIQLHGDEHTEPFVRMGYRVIKAVPVSETFDPGSAARIPPAVTILLDAHDPTRHGGTGQTVNWTAAAGVAASRRTILSGGLTPGNVCAALDQVRPYAIDVSSGVEAAPGVKDPEKLRALFRALQSG